MPTSCCAYNCNERSRPGGSVAFHRFPTKNEMLFRAWCVALRRKDFHPTWASRVCSKHFTKDSYDGGFKTRKLKRDAVPTIFNFGKMGKRRYKLKKSPPKTKRNKNTAGRYKAMEILSDEDTDTSNEVYTLEEKSNAVEIIKLRRDNSFEESGMECHQEQFKMSEGSVDDTTKVNVTADNIVKFDNLPSDQITNMRNENEILRQTIHHLNKKIERFKCLTNVLRSNDLISEEAAEVLRVRIAFPFINDQITNMQNDNEILRQTIHHLNKKIERFKCLANVLRSNDLISEEAAEVLRYTIDMYDC